VSKDASHHVTIFTGANWGDEWILYGEYLESSEMLYPSAPRSHRHRQEERSDRTPGVNGHGARPRGARVSRNKASVFAYALIDALHHSETNNDGLITLSALAAHVHDLVPKLVNDTKEREALLTRGQPGDTQSARFGSNGEDFPFVRRLP
jgi:hypothetical protein